MTEIPFYVLKPLRSSHIHPILDRDRVISNTRKGIETQIYLDLNILSKIHESISKSNPADPSVVAIVQFLHSFSGGVYLAPGIALEEVAPHFALPIYRSFEKFCSMYSLNFSDAYNAIPLMPNKRDILRFFDLSSGQQNILATSYASLLYVHYIHTFFPRFSNQEKFKLYGDHIASSINRFDALGYAIAMLYFTDASNAIAKIKRNFIKQPENKQKVLKNSLNAAWDISFYRCIAYSEVLSKVQQDFSLRPMECWCLTFDAGIAALSELIFYDEESTLKGMDSASIALDSEILKYNDDLAHNFELFNYRNHVRRALHQVKDLLGEEHTYGSLATIKKFINKTEESFYKLQ